MNKLGFGFLRLPQVGGKNIDWPLLEAMVDEFLAGGGTYFDTAYTYLDGMSEAALKRAVVERHPRASFQIADKLPGWKVKRQEDCQRYFSEQLERCGVDFFDYFRIYNGYSRYPTEGWKMEPVYASIAQTNGRASDCIHCHVCERNCPQQISITQWLAKVAKALE